MKKYLFLFLSIAFFSCEKQNAQVSPRKDIIIKKAFFFGDSHTQAGKFGKYTAQYLGCEYSECSKSGSQAKHYTSYDSIQKMVNYNPDIVIIRLGTNDIALNDDINVAIGNYNKLISMIRQNTSVPIIFVNITKISNAGFNLQNKIVAFNSFIASKGDYIDLYNFSDYNYIHPDLIHFYPAGYSQQGKMTSLLIRAKY